MSYNGAQCALSEGHMAKIQPELIALIQSYPNPVKILAAPHCFGSRF
jgi:hypothetical protein